MALVLRNIVVTAKKASGAPWANAEFRFSISDTQADGAVIVPKFTVPIITNAQGVGTGQLYTLENSYLNYDTVLPGGDSQEISFPDEPGDALLAELWETAAQAAEIAIRPATLETLGGVMPDGVTITIDENGVISAIGGGAEELGDLTDVSLTSPASDDILQRKSGVWVNRTPAQVKTDMSLGNVNNTSDASKPVSTAQQTALDLKANLTPTVNAQTGTTYTLQASDKGKIITFNNASAVAVTVPSGLGAGFNCVCVQIGAGEVSFSGSGAAVNNWQGHSALAGQYAVASLKAYAANIFVLEGDTAPGPEPIALVASTAKFLGEFADTTDPIDTTGASLIVVAVASYSSVTPSVSDSKGSTWTALTKYMHGSSTTSMQLFYSKNPNVGSNHTFIVTGSGIYESVAVAAFSGTDTAVGIDGATGAVSGPGAVTTLQPGSVTPSEDNCVLVTALAVDSPAAVLSINSGFTIAAQLGSGSGASYNLGIAYKVQTAAQAENPTWTSDTAGLMAAAIAAFKPA